jgi:hypothetical protein
MPAQQSNPNQPSSGTGSAATRSNLTGPTVPEHLEYLSTSGEAHQQWCTLIARRTANGLARNEQAEHEEFVLLLQQEHDERESESRATRDTAASGRGTGGSRR